MSHTVLAQSPSAYGIYFEETFFPKYVNENDTSSITTAPGVADETGLGFNTKTTLGYLFGGRSFLFGLTYNQYSLSTKRKNVVGGDPGLKETTNETQLGPTLGWFYGRFRVLYTHFMSGEKSVDTKNFDANGPTAHAVKTYSELEGYQITIGYAFAMWGVEIGPTLVYTVREYEKQSNKDKLNSTNNYKNVKLFTPNRDSELEPMLSFIIRF